MHPQPARIRRVLNASRSLSVASVLLVASASPLLLVGGCVSGEQRARDLIDAGPTGKYTASLLAANSIPFSSGRANALLPIARSSDLGQSDQAAILAILSSNSGFSGDHREVLVALVSNPACTAETKVAVGRHLDTMVGFSDDRAKVAAALTKSAGK